MKKILLFFSVFFLLILFFGLFYVRENWCPKKQMGGVYISDFELPESIIYDCKNGDIIVLLVEKNIEKGMFLISKQKNEVGFLSGSDFFRFSSGLYSRYFPYHLIIIGGDSGKSDINPNLIINSDEISFRFNSENKTLAICPDHLVNDIDIRFQDYVAELRNPKNVELRKNFESRFDYDNSEASL